MFFFLQVPKKRLTLSSLIVIAFLTLTGSLVAAKHLFANEIGIGIDSYYYAIQINQLVEQRRLYFVTSAPATIYFLAVLKVVTQDTILAIKLGTLVLNLLLTLGVYSVVRMIINSSGIGLFSVLVVSISSINLYLVVEYVNYLGALAAIVWGIFFSFLTVKRRRSGWAAPALGCFVFAFFSHRSAAPITLTLILCLALFLSGHSTVRNDRLRVLAWAMIVLAFFAPAILDAQPFFRLPPELARDFMVFPRIPSQLATMPELFALVLLCPLTLVAIFKWKVRAEERLGSIFFGTVALWGVLILLNPFISSLLGFLSVGGRLRTLSHIVVALLCSGVIWLLYDSRKKLMWLTACVVISTMIWSAFFNPLPRGAQPEYLAHRKSLIESLNSHKLVLDQNSLVVAEHGEQFVVTSITGLPSQQTYPNETRYDTVYWLLNKIPSTLIDSTMIPMFKDPDGLYTVLAKEGPTWNDRMQNPQIRAQFSKYNFHLRNHLANREAEWIEQEQ